MTEPLPGESPFYLFSIDLEDVRKEAEAGIRYPDRVPQMTEKLLAFLDEHQVKTTFFVVGELAHRHPSLIRDVVTAGHEVGCHSHRHRALRELGPQRFAEDLKQNLEALQTNGAEEIVGFRAPLFSLVEETQWAYEILAEHGFLYSSSVLPAKSPVFGWESFGQDFRRQSGVWELPVSVAGLGRRRVPFAGGIYFRVLPWWLIKRELSSCSQRQRPVIGYLHPQDFDGDQERFRYANYNPFFNYLLYYNRKRCFSKLAKVIATGCRIVPYRSFVRTELTPRTEGSA